MHKISSCPCCGHATFKEQDILWPDLIKQWGLTKDQAHQVNRQQGLQCASCNANLRSMTLAQAIMRCFSHNGTLHSFVGKRRLKHPRVLEINEAGHLNPILQKLKHHTLGSYPEVDIMQLPYADNSYDLVVHSDTLEHVSDPVKALRETLRVLKPGGFTCYTVPFVVGRETRRRTEDMSASYHGSPGNNEYLVHTEYGHDAWTEVMRAGFSECRLVTLDYPASVAIVGVA